MPQEDVENLVVQLAEQVRDRYYGKYRGLVDEVGKDGQLGLIKAKVPSVFGCDRVSPWARPAVPFAGRNHGFLCLPQKDDGVWIEFEEGFLSKPIWTGFWWADGELPSPSGPEQRVLITPEGLKVILDDKNKILELVHPGGAKITMTDDGITLAIGKTSIVLSSSGVNVNKGAFKVSS